MRAWQSFVTLFLGLSLVKDSVMGMDIYSGRGVVATVDEFLGVINSKNKRLVLEVCKKFHNELVSQAEADKDSEWKQLLAECFEPLSKIPFNSTLVFIRGAIQSCIEVRGEVSKYGECHVEHAEYVETLFNQIVEVSGLDLPYIEQVTAWGSCRYNGWDVPKGVACVVLDSDSCYERTLSDQGKAVKKLLGHCDETEWTEMSV